MCMLDDGRIEMREGGREDVGGEGGGVYMDWWKVDVVSCTSLELNFTNLNSYQIFGEDVSAFMKSDEFHLECMKKYNSYASASSEAYHHGDRPLPYKHKRGMFWLDCRTWASCCSMAFCIDVRRESKIVKTSMCAQKFAVRGCGGGQVSSSEKRDALVRSMSFQWRTAGPPWRDTLVFLAFP